MKKILILLLTLVTVLGCSKNDDAETNAIVGQWKLMRTVINGVAGPTTFDYSAENILYRFNENETLVVSGEENAIHSNGEHEYFFGEDYYPGDTTGPKALLVKIDEKKWVYNLTDGEMHLEDRFVADLFFVKN
ncbi:hypothetical protein [Aequorivita capsosiphonis]|uniref:hypothetical protein n=1 Tax=Aequorivita capsosiphonis TaxID=487317 RepID=UPI000422A6BE|nr:hypothetical protein [Aequorivita capsosiphonis]